MRTDAAVTIPTPLTISAENLEMVVVGMKSGLPINRIAVPPLTSFFEKAITIAMFQRKKDLVRLTTTSTGATID